MSHDSTHLDDLSTEEIEEEMRGATGDLIESLRYAAKRAYSTVHPADFAFCVHNHLTEADGDVLREAGTYFCHVCGRLLKSRHPLPASAALNHERHRRELLWHVYTGRPISAVDLTEPKLARTFADLSTTLAAADENGPGVTANQGES